MQLVRTTVRLHQPLKNAADKKAQELDITFQALLTKALKMYLQLQSSQAADEIVFKVRDVGEPVDNLDREAIYAD